MTGSTEGAVTYRLDGSVAVIRIDDGKANAISHAIAAELDRGLTQAETDTAGAVVIAGRPGRFSAGFDLTVMRSGIDEARDLLRVGAELALRIYTFPAPVVLGVTGHALAMGAILLLAADTRIGAAGEFKIGLNEVAIGMPVPRFATELARDRLSPRHLTAAVNHARIYDPTTAVDAGYLDEVVSPDDVEQAALDHAGTLATTLNPAGFRRTREHLRGERAERVRAGLAADIAAFVVEP
ncbi:crotonase/enoyl-CoA hydratase family protein [Rhabdothermincola sediminis]|uniref:crotonase/enoyl-CoA hydratase family protein n=1 Tax=Rhabdothermincola sediminis TaxID=2751370 RepID=UPI001AA02F88|nr:crotonase/enoyl-CoA hydratase family protein [Rhabdothermincola sediminis]